MSWRPGERGGRPGGVCGVGVLGEERDGCLGDERGGRRGERVELAAWEVEQGRRPGGQ